MSTRLDRILFRAMVLVLVLAALFLAARTYLNEGDTVAVAGAGQTATPRPLSAGAEGAVAADIAQLVVTTPVDGALLEDDRPLLSGTASPRARVEVGDRTTVADESGRWSATASLTPGANSVRVHDTTSGETVRLSLRLPQPAAATSTSTTTAVDPPVVTPPVTEPAPTTAPTTTTEQVLIAEIPKATTAPPTTQTTTTAPPTTRPSPTTTEVVTPRPTPTPTPRTPATSTTTERPQPKPTTTTTTERPKPTTTTTTTTTTEPPRTTEPRECSRQNPQACRGG